MKSPLRSFPEIFDVGANVGEKAEWLSQRGLKVICVEPQPAMVDQLKTRFSGNRNVTVVPKALGSVSGSLETSISTRLPTLSTFAEHWKKGRFAGVEWDAA